MIIKGNRARQIKIFAFISFVTVICLFSAKNIQAQSFQFPVYPYFSPFVPYPTLTFPTLAPSIFPFTPILPPTRLPTASIQGTTVFVPTTLTTFGINVPGFGGLLTSISPPITIFIYPTGYVPPAPIVPTVIAPTVIPPTVVPPPPPTVIAPTIIPPPAPTIIAPTVVAPTVIAPTVVPPTVIAPTVVPPTIIAPTTALPSTTEILAAPSGVLFPFSFPYFFWF